MSVWSSSRFAQSRRSVQRYQSQCPGMCPKRRDSGGHEVRRSSCAWPGGAMPPVAAASTDRPQGLEIECKGMSYRVPSESRRGTRHRAPKTRRKAREHQTIMGPREAPPFAVATRETVRWLPPRTSGFSVLHS
eukprot:scaffold664_cov260-Pinguiococcus_pyrenoidosus.AAC.33